MEIVTNILVGAVVMWVTLLVVVPLAGRVAQFTFPGWKDAVWKLAVVALATNASTEILQPINGMVGWIAGMILFWFLMVKWFDVNMLGAVLIIIISFLVRLLIVGALIAAMA